MYIVDVKEKRMLLPWQALNHKSKIEHCVHAFLLILTAFTLICLNGISA